MAQSSLETAENVNSDSRSGVGSFEEPQVSGPQEIDWRRLKRYKAACSIKKNHSWIWQHGYRLWNEDQLEFWLCKRCHHGPVKRPFPKGHIFQTTRATSTAALHMTKQHSINENGIVTPSGPLSKKRKLEDCNFDSNAVQHRTVSSFGPNQFRALLLQWIIADSIPFQKIESDYFFGSDVDAFESELQDLSLEEQELGRWRKKGPTGKLHNVVKYITASPQRIETFEDIQRRNSAGEKDGAVLKLVKDNFTRWNSFDDCAERAIRLRASIDEYIEEERDNWINYQRRPDQKRHEKRYAGGKQPSILQDQLSSDDWDVVVQYHEILRPFRSATLQLQGQIGGCTGAIWQVLPVFERLLTHLEDQRYNHRPPESQSMRSNSLNDRKERDG
jgi:hypothetical protein